MVLEGGIRRLSGCKHGVVQVSTKYVQIFRMDSAAESFPLVDGLIIQSGLVGAFVRVSGFVACSGVKIYLGFQVCPGRGEVDGCMVSIQNMDNDAWIGSTSVAVRTLTHATRQQTKSY